MKYYSPKRKRQITYVILILLILFVIIYYILLEKYVNSFLQGLILKYGYQIIFLISFFLELIPQPFISALIPFTLGVIVGLDFQKLLLYVVVASIIANYAAYYVGLKYGSNATKYLINEENFKKTDKWFKKHGIKSIAFLALTPLPYFPVIGGIYKMTLREFTFFAIVPRLFHFAIFSYLIYFVF